jgi:hypothetical protein
MKNDGKVLSLAVLVSVPAYSSIFFFYWVLTKGLINR